ncbi:AAEL005534-PA, partial [Aedes aegypti]
FVSPGHLARHGRIHTGEKPFQCTLCDKAFTEASSLKVHLRTHTGEKPYRCELCSWSFAQSCNLQSHYRRSHGPFQCCVCEEPFFDRDLLLIHEETHVPEAPFECRYCNTMFGALPHFRSHQKNIFSKKSLKCEKCEKVFEKELTLKKHMDMVHPVVSSVSSGDGSFLLEALKTDARSLSPAATKSGKVQISSEVEVPESDDVIEIKQEPESALGDDQVNSTVSDNPILTQLLNTNSDLQQPSQQHSPCNGTPDNAPADNDHSNEGGFVISAVATVDHNFLERLERMEQQQKKQQEQMELDSQPVSSARRMPVLEESLRRPPISSNRSSAVNLPPIIPSGPFRCSFCLKEFNEHFGLRQHIRAMHYSEKRHKCKECNKKFSLGISLAIHRRVHTSIRPFTCIVCYKTFTRSTALNGHLSSHSYVRVKCAECGEVQLSVYNYMKHIEKFHPDFMQNVAAYRTQ